MCRYVSLMKKGSEAGATLRDGAADLWRKGVALAWRVPANSTNDPMGEMRPTPLRIRDSICWSCRHAREPTMTQKHLADLGVAYHSQMVAADPSCSLFTVE